MSIYVIGDTHGSFKTLRALVAQLPPGAHIALAGDLIDRGPRSRQVVQWVIDNGIDCVMGNHEDMMVREGHLRNWGSIWMQNGGIQTLDSYCDEQGEVDEKTFREHQAWMAELPLMLSYPEERNEAGRHLVVSHSSCGSVWHWDEARREAQQKAFESIVLWGRSPPKDAPEIYNVFGHTPQPTGPRIKVPFANIDTGCCYTSHEGQYGVLTALQFPEMKVYSQKNIDQEPVKLEDE